MKQLLVFIQKEFYHVFRDRRTLLIMFGLPVAEILLFGFALTNEVKNVNTVIVDESDDVHTRQIISKIRGSAYFTVQRQMPVMSAADIEAALRQGQTKCILIFGQNFGKDLQALGKAQVQIIADGSDPNTAKTIINYTNAIIADYQTRLNAQAAKPAYMIVPQPRMLYNETATDALNFVPGVLAYVLMIVCTALTSVAVVREKELGTMEILLVSPFNPVLVLVAKAVPYLVLSLCNFTLILVLSVFVLGVPIQGSIGLLLLVSMLFIATCLSWGLVISNITNSQQTALLISMFVMMLPTLIFTGFMFPLENMPLPLQIISNLVPARWYYEAVKAVMVKGLGLAYIWKQMLILSVMTLILLGLALKNFKIRLT